MFNEEEINIWNKEKSVIRKEKAWCFSCRFVSVLFYPFVSLSVYVPICQLLLLWSVFFIPLSSSLDSIMFASWFAFVVKSIQCFHVLMYTCAKKERENDYKLTEKRWNKLNTKNKISELKICLSCPTRCGNN